MRPEHTAIRERGVVLPRRAPSLVDLCVQKAVDNLGEIGNVGDTDDHLLERILSHCTVDQLMVIEDSTRGRDLSEVTNKLWSKFYSKEFGSYCFNLVVERMKQHKVCFKWKQLFEAKLKEMKGAQQRSIDRILQLYESEKERKQSRQIRLCNKVPPSKSKRSFFGGGWPRNSVCNSKSSLMKKARLEALNSREVQNLAAMRKNKVQSNYRTSTSRVSSTINRRI